MVRTRRGARAAAGLPGTLLAALVLTACAGASGPAGRARVPAEETASSTPSSPVPSATSSARGRSTPGASATTPGSRPEPRRAHLSVPALGLRDVVVRRYRGRPDDAPGTRIQNGGVLASPRGPRGGVGPGEVGNLLVTGHRTSHGAPFARLPMLRRGELVRVRSAGIVHVYRIVTTRSTSFRSPASRARQEAAVPGRPGVSPTRAMITLSTCATPEDHARDNFWSDRFGNPEHRIDKIGVLVRSTAGSMSPRPR